MSNPLLGLGAWPRIGGQVLIEGFLGGEPVTAESLAFDQFLTQEAANVSWCITCILRRFLDRDPLWQGGLLGTK
jgi:hypothetical protein